MRINDSQGLNTEVLDSHFGDGFSLALDWIGKKLFFARTVRENVDVMELDGSSQGTFINHTDIHQPAALVVDSRNGYSLSATLVTINFKQPVVARRLCAKFCNFLNDVNATNRKLQN